MYIEMHLNLASVHDLIFKRKMLLHIQSNTILPFHLIQVKSSNSFFTKKQLVAISHNGQVLSICQDGSVSFVNNQDHGNSVFELMQHSLYSFSLKCRNDGCYLCFDSNEGWYSSTFETEHSRFQSIYTPTISPETTFDHLSKVLKEEFVQNGFFIVKNVIPKSLIHDALKAINGTLGHAIQNGNDMNDMKSNTQCSHPDIVKLLYKSKAFTFVQDLVGYGMAGKPDSAQVALRFPSPMQYNSQSQPEWHIDGPGEVFPFSLLVGISLNQQESNGGCFFVYPSKFYTDIRSNIYHE